jgi:predicted acyltransferase
MLRAILRRVVVLILLGWVYNGLLEMDFARLRYASVLGLIGISYGIAAAVALVTRRARVPLLGAVVIMAAVAAAQLLVPVPGHGPGVLTPAGALNGYIDRMLLPGRLFGKTYDPEGLLCVVSAAALTLLGLSCGRLLRAPHGGSFGKALVLAGTGALMLASGKLLAPWYPPIKALWTSSYNLIAGGIALGLMALFYLVIDGWRLHGWSFALRVVGLNSITIYLAVRFVDFGHTAGLLFGGLAARCGPWQPVVVTGATLLIEWLFLWLLYRREIFLKV